MSNKLKLLAFVTCAAFIHLSVPANAGPKADCEIGLKQAEKDFSNSSLDAPAAKSVGNRLGRARDAQKEGKNKKCVKLVNGVKNTMGTK